MLALLVFINNNKQTPVEKRFPVETKEKDSNMKDIFIKVMKKILEEMKIKQNLKLKIKF